MEQNPALDTLHFQNNFIADTDEAGPTRGHLVSCDAVNTKMAGMAQRPTR